MWVLYDVKRTRKWAERAGVSLVRVRGDMVVAKGRGRRRRGKAEVVHVDLVPGYVFSETAPGDEASAARDAHGQRLSVSHEELQLVRCLWDESQAVSAVFSGSPPATPDLQVGSEVTISSGPFESMRASVVSLHGPRVRVLIEGFSLPVEMSPSLFTAHD